MIGWPTVRWCAVACLLGDESQHPTWPHVMQMRRWTQRSPMRRQSSQPRALGVTRPDLIEVAACGARRPGRARPPARCRSRCECLPTPAAIATASSVPDAEERRRLRERLGRAGQHQLVAGPHRVARAAGDTRTAPPRRTASTSSRQPLDVVEAGRRARRPRTVTVRRARQSGPSAHSTTGAAGRSSVAQGRIAATAHRLLVALDLLGRQVVAAHHVGEELHDALQLLGDDAVGAGRRAAAPSRRCSACAR